MSALAIRAVRAVAQSIRISIAEQVLPHPKSHHTNHQKDSSFPFELKSCAPAMKHKPEQKSRCGPAQPDQRTECLSNPNNAIHMLIYSHFSHSEIISSSEIYIQKPSK
jgi:hypothetical protein